MTVHVDEDLGDEEIDRICHPLVQNAAKVRYLESLGLTVQRKPGGRPLVNRAHYRRVRGGEAELEAAGACEPAWRVPA